VKYRFKVSLDVAKKLKMEGCMLDGYKYLKCAIEHDKKSLNPLCPALKESFINLKGRHFDKMRVPHALQVRQASILFLFIRESQKSHLLIFNV
jgi:hypothetical protein